MRFMTALTLALAALCCVPASAADEPTLIITPTGYHLLTLDSAGDPVCTKITNVIRKGDVPPDGPTPPPPAPDDSLAEQVRELAKAVNDPTGAQALAVVYGKIAEGVEKGTIPPQQAFEAVRLATEQVLSNPQINSLAKWTNWRIALGNIANNLQSQGKLDTANAQDVSKLLRSIEAGLDTSAAESPALGPIILQIILQIIIQILQDLLNGGGGGDIPGPF